MRITYEGAVYDFDMADVTVKQGIKIEKHMGCPFTDWGDALAKGSDLRAIQCLGWLILHGGRDVPIEDTDFKMKALSEAFAAAAEVEAAAEAAANPVAGPTVPAAANGRLSEEGRRALLPLS
jgi:hypothetical protein